MQQAREAGMFIDHVTDMYCADTDMIRGGKALPREPVQFGWVSALCKISIDYNYLSVFLPLMQITTKLIPTD